MEHELYNCDKCRHVFYDPNDREEGQKCMVIRMKEKPELNEEIMEMMRRGVFLENVCEYWDGRR